jgi:hypothetical protein
LTIGSYSVVFEVTASGGAAPVSVTVPLRVDCSPIMHINTPVPLQAASQNTTFKTNSGDQSYIVNEFSTGVTGCGIASYSFASTSSKMTQTGCSKNTNVVCRTMTMKTDTTGSFDGYYTIMAVGGASISQQITLKIAAVPGPAPIINCKISIPFPT